MIRLLAHRVECQAESSLPAELITVRRQTSEWNPWRWWFELCKKKLPMPD